MASFDDYHRTVVGYHGTGLAAALKVVYRIENFQWSERDYDWPGGGVYFWEYGPKQAMTWARLRQRQYAKKAHKPPEDQRRATEPLAVVACTIRMSFCLDPTEPENTEFMERAFADYKESIELSEERFPKNDRHYRRLDRAVFEYAYTMVEESDLGFNVDTARGVYVPAGGKKRVWTGS